MESSDNKAQHGNEFKKDVLRVLLDLKEKRIVKMVELDKKIAANPYVKPQFLAPFYMESEDTKYVIFTTTSARSDRIKINQWDANGIKNAYSANTKCFLVLPSILSEKEYNHYSIEATRIKEAGYISAIDEIFTVDKLTEFVS